MAESTVLSVRISRSTKERLQRLAEGSRRSQSFLAAEAIEEFVSIQEWQIAGIKQALASLDRGEGVPHEAVKAWVESWGTEDERPMPESE